MKELTDEEIQELLDTHKDIEPSEEAILYKAIFKELSKPLNASADDLAGQVIKELGCRIERRAWIKTYALVALSLVAGISVFITGVLTIDSAAAEILKDKVYQLRWTIVFLCCMLGLIAVIERKLNTSLHAKRM